MTTTLERFTAGTAAETGTERQVVILHLGEETYGADIAAVHTVITPPAITPVPKTDAWVVGVINLRGRVLPVVDLRARFGLPPRAEEQRHKSRIVVVETGGTSAGLIVDGVSEVLRLPTGAISPPSHLVVSSGNDCITGIGRLAGGHHEGRDEDERLILLLDVARIVGAEELKAAA